MQGCNPRAVDTGHHPEAGTALPEHGALASNRARSAAILIIVMGLVSVWIDLGRFHHTIHSDGLLPVMMSLQKWTPFLWGQDRLGAPVALLAAPIRHPLYNLLFQAAVMIWLALLALPFVARLVGLRNEVAAVGTLSAVMVLTLLGRFRLYDLLWIEPYAQSLFFGAVGLLALESSARGAWLRRLSRLTGLACLFLGHYLNLALVLTILPLAVVRPGASQRVDCWSRRRTIDVAAILGTFAVSLACTQLCAAPHESYGPRPIRAWWSAYVGVAGALIDVTPDRTWVVCAILLVTGAAGMWSSRISGPTRRRTLLAVSCLLLAAASHFLGLVTSRHILADRTGARYAYMTLILVLTASAVWAVVPWFARLGGRGRRLLESGLLGALLIVGPVRYGLPSLSGVTQGLRAHSGAVARDVVNGRVRFLVGGYWKIYPALFLANLDLYERGHQEPVWGLTEKAVATRLLWRPDLATEAHYAMILGDERSGRFYLKRYRVPDLEQVATTDNIRIMRATSSPGLSRSSASKNPRIPEVINDSQPAEYLAGIARGGQARVNVTAMNRSGRPRE